VVRIRVAELGKAFGGRWVLSGVSFAVEAGETLVVLGPSGGGKSTLLRCVAGLLPFEAGWVQVDRRVLRGGERVCRVWGGELGFIFQDFALFPHKRAWENVALAPRVVRRLPAKQARELAFSLLAKVGMAERAEAFPRELSGGERQRVAIARALAMEPSALLGDEITSALDPERKWEVVETLAKLKAEGLTMLLVTHEVALARRLADRVLLLAEGKVVEEGSPGELLDSPRTPELQRFLARAWEPTASGV